MELIPGNLNNSFGYNFNGFSAINNNLNGFANLNAGNNFHFGHTSMPSSFVNTHGPDSLTAMSLANVPPPETHSDQFAYNYEQLPAHSLPSSTISSASFSTSSSSTIPTSGSSNMPVISLFKLKNFLTNPKFASTKLQTDGLTNSAIMDGNTAPSLTSLNSNANQSFYSNLAPSAIGGQAIVTSPLLLSQQASLASTSTNLTQSIYSSSVVSSSMNPSLKSSSMTGSLTTQNVSRTLTSNIPTASVTANKKFTCKMCSQTFQSKSELQLHVAAHMREAKPYKCTLCRRTFANSSYLSQHNRIHAGLKPYSCQLCDRRFTQLSHLNQHIRTHTGAKPYRCKFANCFKSFSQLSNLQSHTRSHESDRPFKCNSCYKTFDDDAQLKAHIPKHRESKHLKLFICDHCGKSYSQEVYLLKHMEKHAEKKESKSERAKAEKRSKSNKSASEPAAKRSAANRSSNQATGNNPSSDSRPISQESNQTSLLTNASSDRSLLITSMPSASVNQSPMHLQSIATSGYSHLSPVSHLPSSHQLNMAGSSTSPLSMFTSNAPTSMHMPIIQTNASMYSSTGAPPTNWSMCKLDSLDSSMLIDSINSHNSHNSHNPHTVDSTSSPNRYETLGESNTQLLSSTQSQSVSNAVASNNHGQATSGSLPPTSSQSLNNSESESNHLVYNNQSMSNSIHSSAFTPLTSRSPATTAYPFAYDGFSFTPMVKSNTSHQSPHSLATQSQFTHQHSHSHHLNHPQSQHLSAHVSAHHLVQSHNPNSNNNSSNGNQMPGSVSPLSQPLLNATLPQLTNTMASPSVSSSVSSSSSLSLSQANLGAQQTHHQLIALNQIRNYAGSVQPIAPTSDRPVIVNNVLFGSTGHPTGSNCAGDYPIMII